MQRTVVIENLNAIVKIHRGGKENRKDDPAKQVRKSNGWIPDLEFKKQELRGLAETPALVLCKDRQGAGGSTASHAINNSACSGLQSPSAKVLQMICGLENRDSAANHYSFQTDQAPPGTGKLTAAQKHVAACLANEQKDLSRVSNWKAGQMLHRKDNGRIKSMDLASI